MKRYYFVSMLLLVCLCAGCSLDHGKKEYSMGKQAYEAGDYLKAAEYFDRALEENPDQAEYYLYRGFTYLELKDYDKAQATFKKVILDKEIKEVQQNDKRALRGIGIACFESGDLTKAMKYFYAALRVKELPEMDEDIRDYMEQVNTKLLAQYRESGNREAVLELCESLKEEYGASAELDRLQADVYMELGQYENALKAFKAAADGGIDDVNTMVGQMAALQALGRKEQYNTLSVQLLNIEPKNDKERLSVAITAYAMKEYVRATEEFESLRKKYEKASKPDERAMYSESLYYLSQIKLQQAMYDEALGLLDTLMKTGLTEKFSVSEVLYQKAVCLLDAERYAEALAICDELEAEGDHAYGKKTDRIRIAVYEGQCEWKKAFDALVEYKEQYDLDQKSELDEYQREYEFLKRIVE